MTIDNRKTSCGRKSLQKVKIDLLKNRTHSPNETRRRENSRRRKIDSSTVAAPHVSAKLFKRLVVATRRLVTLTPLNNRGE